MPRGAPRPSRWIIMNSTSSSSCPSSLRNQLLFAAGQAVIDLVADWLRRRRCGCDAVASEAPGQFPMRRTIECNAGRTLASCGA